MAERRSDLELLRRLLRLARPYWPHLLGICALSLVSAPLALLVPLPLKIAVDSVLGGQPLPGPLERFAPSGLAALALAAGLAVAVGVLAHLQGLASWILETYTGDRLVLRFRARLFAHVQRLSLAYHDSQGSTDSTFRIQYDAPAIQWILIQGVTPLLTSAVTLAGMVAVTARLDGQLALVALAVVPVLLLIRHFSSRRLRHRWTRVREIESSAMSVVQEALAALRVVKAFGQEQREQERFLDRAVEGARGQFQLAVLQGGLDLLVGLTMAAGTAAVLVIGVWHVQAGTLTLGSLLIVMAYLAQLYAPLEMVSRKMGQLQASLASADRAFVLLDQVPDVVERADAIPLRRAAGAIAFQDVSFTYRAERSDSRVLRDVSFAVRAGARVGIKGATGAGKTTLVNLLTRFYDVTSGRILLDGRDVRDYRVADLREQFAIVLQEPVLFSASVAENIAYARPGASQAVIAQAARAANAHDFILRLPQGYETQVGERGMRLSGGERQRVSIARAFLKDAPILILDEPTAAVDVRTEAAIMDALERLMKGRTTFIIAHRLSTLKNCDLLLTIRAGRLVEAALETSAP
jgi:ATP-binding cassette subfamily B protein